VRGFNYFLRVANTHYLRLKVTGLLDQFSKPLTHCPVWPQLFSILCTICSGRATACHHQVASIKAFQKLLVPSIGLANKQGATPV